MAMFQHHPDGWIYVRGTDKTYCDTPANFVADLGNTYGGLPDGYISRIYIPSKRHILSDGDNETVQEIPWAHGDQYIAALDTLLTNQTTRTTATTDSSSSDASTSTDSTTAADSATTN